MSEKCYEYTSSAKAPYSIPVCSKPGSGSHSQPYTDIRDSQSAVLPQALQKLHGMRDAWTCPFA